MNFDIIIEHLQEGHVRRMSVLGDGKALSYADVVAGWRGGEDFRRFFIGVLADAPFDAYFWETPPVTRAGQAGAGTIAETYQIPRSIAKRLGLAAQTAQKNLKNRTSQKNPDAPGLSRTERIPEGRI